MEHGEIYKAGVLTAPKTVEACIYPDIDATYSERTYKGERIRIQSNARRLGIKQFHNLPSNMQGFAIYGNIAVRMANVSVSTTHYVYRVTATGFTLLGQFTLDGTGHSNALQFGTTIPSGRTIPYLYVAALDGYCYVIQIAENYTSASIVQTISITGGGQVLRGDDGFIWSITNANGHRCFAKYRSVDVSEGASISLTNSDKLDEWVTQEEFPSASYTFQGWKAKNGLLWILYGTTGNGQSRGLVVYDTATHRLCSSVDLSDIGNVEFEDLDFWDDAMILALYSSATYILRF